MQVSSKVYEGSVGNNTEWSEMSFRYCEFKDVTTEGAHVDSEFVRCKFADCDFYWGLFNLAVFIGVKFENCKFRGCSFADCIFVECEFRHCDFVFDNLGGNCSFDGTRWYGCKQYESIGIESTF